MMSPYYQMLRSKVGKQRLLVPSVAAVIHDGQGRLLIQERSSDEAWSLPGGAIEPGETPESAIRREVEEETGFEVKTVHLLGVFGGEAFRYVYPNGDPVEYMVALYQCRISDMPVREPDAETKSIRFFTREEAPALVLPYPDYLLFE